MKDLFDPVLVGDVERRILRLRVESERQWGSMTVAQMLAHCTAGMEMAMGVINARRAAFPFGLLGLVIKPLVFRDDAPMRRNSPSVPELFEADATRCELEHERARLVAAIGRFAGEGAACCSDYPHPFFGRLKPEQWAVLMYKHVDHHLRQFGV